MSVSETFVIPGVRAVLRRALPNIIEGKLVPLGLFLACYRLSGTAAALVAGLTWSALSITVEYPNGQGVSIEPMSPGETIFIDAPAGAIPRACGTKEQSVYIKFYDELGALVFELRARYGCAQCKAKKAQ